MRILSIDPSGNFIQGKGETGYCFFNLVNNKFELIERGTIRAKDFDNQFEYWREILDLLDILDKVLDHVILEDYRGYVSSNKNNVNTGNLFETARLLGLLTFALRFQKTPYTMQMASYLGKNYSDENMVKLGYFYQRLSNNGSKTYKQGGKRINEHERMAFRHFVRWVDKIYKYNLEEG